MTIKELNYLEQEFEMMIDNIKRVKEYANHEDNKRYKPSSSLVIGELKHRAVTLKQRLTKVSKTNTWGLCKSITEK